MPIANELLEFVARRNTKRVDVSGCIEHPPFFPGSLLELAWQSFDEIPSKYGSGFLVTK